MKSKLTILLTLMIVVFSTACNKGKTYSQLQDEEQVVIENYIKSNNIQVVTTLPESGEWGENVYYKSPSGLYFHMINEGVKTDSIRSNTQVGFRYIERNIDEKNSIRRQNWEPRDFKEPITFIYGSASVSLYMGVGLQEAIGLMKYKYSEAIAIVPSGLNTSEYSKDRYKLYPVIYRLKITSIK